MYTGPNPKIGGRFNEESAEGLTASIAKMGFEYGRLKTGTPPRLKASTIDFSVLEEQPGDNNPEPFSRRTNKKDLDIIKTKKEDLWRSL